MIYSIGVNHFFKVKVNPAPCLPQSGCVVWGAEGPLRRVCSGKQRARAELVSAALISSGPLFVPLFPSLTLGMAEALVVCGL